MLIFSVSFQFFRMPPRRGRVAFGFRCRARRAFANRVGRGSDAARCKLPSHLWHLAAILVPYMHYGSSNRQARSSVLAHVFVFVSMTEGRSRVHWLRGAIPAERVSLSNHLGRYLTDRCPACNSASIGSTSLSLASIQVLHTHTITA